MRLQGRLCTLEKRTGIRGQCPLCGGKGKLVVRACTEEEFATMEPPEGCPHCGNTLLVRIMKFDPADEEVAP